MSDLPWKKLSFFIFVLCLGFAKPDFANAQQAQPPAEPPILLSIKELESLVAPIALYPDPLLAQVLAASTYPLDIVNAARFIQANPNPVMIDRQNWDPSVKAVAHYPSVIEMMNHKLDWTQRLGQAVIDQPKDVMLAIQRLRKRAQKSGALKNTSQQNIVIQKEAIEILPAEPEVIYVPQYDPAIVYTDVVDLRAPLFTFSSGFAIGPWLNIGFSWGQGHLFHGDSYFWRHRHYGHREYYNRASFKPWRHNFDRRGPFDRSRPWPVSFPNRRERWENPNPFEQGPRRSSRHPSTTNRPYFNESNLPNRRQPYSFPGRSNNSGERQIYHPAQIHERRGMEGLRRGFEKENPAGFNQGQNRRSSFPNREGSPSRSFPENRGETTSNRGGSFPSGSYQGNRGQNKSQLPTLRMEPSSNRGNGSGANSSGPREGFGGGRSRGNNGGGQGGGYHGGGHGGRH